MLCIAFVQTLHLIDCHLAEIVSLTNDKSTEKKNDLSGCNADYRECSLIVGVVEMKSG